MLLRSDYLYLRQIKPHDQYVGYMKKASSPT